MVAVLSTVWIVIFGMDRSYPTFVVIGLVLFNYFSYCLSGCANSIVENVSIVKKVAFPRQILPVSTIVTHLLDLATQSLLAVVLILLFPPPGNLLGAQLLWLPVLLAILVGLCTGTGFLVAALHVKYRDVRYLVEVVADDPVLGQPDRVLGARTARGGVVDLVGVLRQPARRDHRTRSAPCSTTAHTPTPPRCRSPCFQRR